MRTVAASLLLTLPFSLAAEQKLVFPPLKAANLAKKEMNLPRDFAGEFNLVLIAFQRDQQREVDTWLKALPNIARAHPRLSYYELPTIKRMNGMTRWFIDNGMRGGIPDSAQRARTITLYIEKEPFRKALNLPSEDRIYALLLNRQGEVVWRSEGLYDETKGQQLLRFLESA